MPLACPDLFANAIADGVESILAHQQPDGSIVYDPTFPIIYPQQSIMPMAFCYAGLGPNPAHKNSTRLRDAIRNLGNFLVSRFDDQGRFAYNSFGYEVNSVDQRLTQAWIEAYGFLKAIPASAGGPPDMPYDKWADKILRACNYLIEHRMKKLVGVRRFISRVLGTSTNHASLYGTTVFRAGQVLGKKELCDFALPIARALAADIHPDGYYEEHGDLLRNGGPTPSYNYLTQYATALMYEWTKEPVFKSAVDKAAGFHANFTYPDGTFLDLIDERVRYNNTPRIWGLFGFSHTPEGRGVALQHMQDWVAAIKTKIHPSQYPESIAKMVDNLLYWHDGPVAPPPYQQPNHHAALTMPAAVYRKGKWFLSVSAMPAINNEDPGYRNNPFALDRQKLFSVWHEKIGLVIDGSHSKNQRDNSTFAAHAEYADDFYPSGGKIGEENGALVAHAAYKSFFGIVRLKPISDSQLEIELSVDPAGNRGPFAVAFTLRRLAAITKITDAHNKDIPLTDQNLSLSLADLGGSFTYGNAKISGPDSVRVSWPFSPFNSYAASGKSDPAANQLRVHTELTPERPSVTIILSIT